MIYESGPYQYIIEAKTSKEAWKQLKTRYRKNTDVIYDEALFSLMNIKADNFKDLNTYLSEFRKHTGKLAEIKEAIPGRIQRAIFRNGLPDYIAPYTFSIYETKRQRNETVDLDKLVSSLID